MGQPLLKRFFKNKDFIRIFFEANFRKLGRSVVLSPLIYIIVPIGITCFLSLGFVFIEYCDDPEYLFTLTNSHKKVHKAFIETNFSQSRSPNYDYGRETRLVSGYARIFLTAGDGKSILRDNITKEILELNQLVEDITINWKEDHLDYKALCSKYYGGCHKNPLIFLINQMKDIKKGKYLIDYPLHLSKNKIDFFMFGLSVGNVTLSNSGKLMDADFGHLYYFLDTMTEDNKNKAMEWESKFLEILQNKKFRNFNISVMTSHSLPSEFINAANRAMPVFRLTLALIIIFSTVTCMMEDCVRSKPWLGVAACISSLMGVAAGFGISMALKFPFPPSNLAVPFIIIGIGIDDAFIVLSSWRKSNPKLSLEERFVETYSHSGVAITVTTVTNVISFLACILTRLPGIELFGIYAAISCIFSYLFQLTFIGGCLTLLCRAEIANYNGNFLICKAIPRSKAKDKNFLFRLLFVGGTDPQNPNSMIQEHYAMLFFRDIIGNFMTKTYAKIIILFIFLVYIVIAITGIFKLEEGMEFRDLFSRDSYAFKFMQMDSKYLSKYPFRIQIIINDTFDYSKQDTHVYFEKFLNNLTSDDNAAPDPLLTEFWLFYYLDFLKDNKDSFWIRGYNLTQKQEFLNCLRFVFFKLPQSQRFKNDIIFNQNYTEIITSRFFIQSYEIWDMKMGIKAIRRAIENVNQEPYNFFMFHPYFVILETILNATYIIVSTIAISVTVILLVTFAFIPNIIVAIWITLSIISIETGVLGYMHYLGFALNPASVFGIIICIGLSVDNATHITCAYVSSKAATPNEKLKDALFHVGLPIFQGCFSTVLGICSLSLLNSYIYNAIYKIGMMVMIFSAFHSVALLPISLSIFDNLFSKSKQKVKYTDNKPQKKEQGEPFI